MTNVHLTETKKIDKELVFKRVVDDLNRALKDSVHVVEGAPQATVMRDDDTYRKTAVHGSQELLFKDVRVGKSGKIIFSFTAVDAMPWKWCEWNAAELDQAVPLFAAGLAETLKYPETMDDLSVLLKQIIADTEAKIITEEEEAVQHAAVAYSHNPKFGAF